MKRNTNFILFPIVLFFLIIAGCDRCQDRNRDIQATVIAWDDIDHWGKTTLPSGYSLQVFIFDDGTAPDSGWVFVVIDMKHEPREDTTIYGPFSGVAPNSNQIEFFENEHDEDDENSDDDDEWVIEYECEDGCCVQVYGKVDGKIKLKKSYTIHGHNCRRTMVDTAAGEKTIFMTNDAKDTVSVLRINYHTGDSIYFGSAPGDEESMKDIEVVAGRTISVEHRNDTNFVTVRSNDGSIIEELIMPGDLVRAKDDRIGSKIIVTKIDTSISSRVLILNTTPIAAGPDIGQYGKLVDLQLHRINDRTYFVVASYDERADVTHVSIIGPDGQGIANHSLKGKFYEAKKRPNDNRKVFVTSDPGVNDGSGVAKIGLYDIVTGAASNPDPSSTRGKPTGLTVDNNGDISVDTEDATGHTSSTPVLPN